MTKKMLIDAAHPEEVRVALLDQGKVEDFDFESAARKPLRGNIYLARVTRVEPSLQAAFVEYGGNRHGFLAFSEIHPDYYQIPVSDRQLLQAAEAEVADLAAQLELVQRGDDDDDVEEPSLKSDGDAGDESLSSASDDGDDADSNSLNADDDNGDEMEDSEDDGAQDVRPIDEEEEEEEVGDEDTEEEFGDSDTDDGGDSDGDVDIPPQTERRKSKKSAEDDVEAELAMRPENNGDADSADEGSPDDSGVYEAFDTAPEIDIDADADDDFVSEDTALEVDVDNAASEEIDVTAREALFERYKEAKRKRARLLRNYKIQEVIKRRQIMLVQVVKEERGNKGAALTTYLSLAGRYCVLMPNTARGGGISRKIPSSNDRRRLRRVVDSLEVPKGMGLIIRTAGAKRTKTEIKRDYDYLLRLWENIRTLTLKSVAPCLIYEEASLIKRAIRDLYDKDIGKVLVEGEAGYREAKDFMKMLMPSHAKNVQPYKDRAPIFLKHNVENQLDGMYQPTVRLKSGGYIVIHQTEALVAIDVNSGRATRERNIELTALKTNIEAAHEAARQFRLRDLAGLIVLDFIDMEEPKNNRKVEKALKEALKLDRARIQVGRISNFGLLEMSRQRRRSGIVDGTTQSCPSCRGAGVVRSDEIAAIRILRAIEGEAISGKVGEITVKASIDVSLHILNHNREWLSRIEEQNGVTIEILADPGKIGDAYDLDKRGAPRIRGDETSVIRADQADLLDDDSAENLDTAAEKDDHRAIEDDEEDRPKRRRRRRRKDRQASDDSDEQSPQNDNDDVKTETSESDDEDGEKPRKRRRRGRRGGRRNRKSSDESRIAENGDDGSDAAESIQADAGDEAAGEGEIDMSAASEEQAETERTSAPDVQDTNADVDAVSDSTAEQPQPEPVAEQQPMVESTPKKPSRRGWWQRVSSR